MEITFFSLSLSLSLSLDRQTRILLTIPNKKRHTKTHRAYKGAKTVMRWREQPKTPLCHKKEPNQSTKYKINTEAPSKDLEIIII